MLASLRMEQQYVRNININSDVFDMYVLYVGRIFRIVYLWNLEWDIQCLYCLLYRYNIYPACNW